MLKRLKVISVLASFAVGLIAISSLGFAATAKQKGYFYVNAWCAAKGLVTAT